MKYWIVNLRRYTEDRNQVVGLDSRGNYWFVGHEQRFVKDERDPSYPNMEWIREIDID